MDTKRIPIAIGSRVGHLTVSGRTGKRKNGYIVWRCACDCGGEIDLDTRTLQRETVTDCGCRTVVRPGMLDLTGMRFGRLVCLSPTDTRDHSGRIQWLCKCDCGNTCLASVSQLKSGYKKSCGCLGHPPINRFTGKRFGNLVVIEYAGKENGMHRWRCLCDCGRETVVGQTLLQIGKTQSCGCLQAGQGVANPEPRDGTSVSVLRARLNRPPIKSNTSGYNGVYRHTKTGKWIAQITFKGKKYHLGSFDDLEDAIRARKRGEEMYLDFLAQNDQSAD